MKVRIGVLLFALTFFAYSGLVISFFPGVDRTVRLLTAGARGVLSGKPLADPDSRLLLYLALATIPGAVAGKLLEEWAETTFRSPALVATTMALMGAVLWLADRRANRVPGDEHDSGKMFPGLKAPHEGLDIVDFDLGRDMDRKNGRDES